MAIMRVELKDHKFDSDPGLVKSVGVINREDKSYVQIMFDSGVSFEEEIYKVILSNTTKESSDAHSQNALLEAEVASAYIM